MSPASRANIEKERPAVHIVVVEDNPADVQLLQKALQDHEIVYQLTVYEDGEQAMRAIATDHGAVPDLILVDLNLPRREGFDVLKLILQRPRLVGVPVAALTSSDANKDRHRTALIGVDRFIHKPPTLDEFINEVGTAVAELLQSRRSEPAGY